MSNFLITLFKSYLCLNFKQCHQFRHTLQQVLLKTACTSPETTRNLTGTGILEITCLTFESTTLALAHHVTPLTYSHSSEEKSDCSANCFELVQHLVGGGGSVQSVDFGTWNTTLLFATLMHSVQSFVLRNAKMIHSFVPLETKRTANFVMETACFYRDGEDEENTIGRIWMNQILFAFSYLHSVFRDALLTMHSYF